MEIDGYNDSNLLLSVNIKEFRYILTSGTDRKENEFSTFQNPLFINFRKIALCKFHGISIGNLSKIDEKCVLEC